MERSLTIEQKFVFKTQEIAILSIFFSTILQAFFGFTRDAPPFFKAIIALLCWISIYYGGKNLKNIKHIYSKTAYSLVVILIILTIFSFLYALILGDVAFGNKYIVIFTNMYSVLDVASIFFIGLFSKISNLKYLLKYTLYIIPISIIILFINYKQSIESYFLTYTSIYSLIFIPYISKTKKILIAIGIALCIFALIGGGRQAGLLIGFNILILLMYHLFNKRFIYITSLVIALSPIVLFTYSISHQSIFEILKSNTNTSGAIDNTDTRTFLYKEVIEDLQSQNITTILTGKGALATYYSDWFDVNSISNNPLAKYRFGVEIPILQWILQCGIIYYLCFSILIFYSIHNIYKNGNNKISSITSLLIAAFYFNCYISNLVGCNIIHLGFWALLSIANNKKILSATERQIQQFFKT